MEKYKCTEPKIGDIIKVEISSNLYHFGLYIGDDKIIHYGTKDFLNNKEDVCVNITSMEDFLGGKMALVRVFSFSEKFKKNSRKKSVKLALDRLGEKKYDPLNNNCEHFVNECVFNKHISNQANKYLKK